MASDHEQATVLSVAATFKQLEEAQRSGDPIQRGEAHLNVVGALAGSMEADSSVADQEGFYRLMYEQAEQALAAYREADFAWGAADAYLVMAALLSDQVEGDSDGPGRQERILQCVDSCYKALSLLSQDSNVPMPMLSQAHATAGAVLLRLREALADMDLPPSLDEWIMAQSENTGETAAWDVQLRSEGNDWLWVAQVSGSLAESLPNEEDRNLASQMAREAARYAAEGLWLSSDGEATRAAWSLHRNGSNRGEG